MSKQTCDTERDCTLDPTTAQCEPGIVPAVELRVHFNGPLCGCSASDHHCHFYWVDPVPCRTEKDCWFDDNPVMHAIPRPARLKSHKFRGCHDGEHEPACVKGRCTLEGLTC